MRPMRNSYRGKDGPFKVRIGCEATFRGLKNPVHGHRKEFNVAIKRGARRDRKVHPFQDGVVSAVILEKATYSGRD